MIASAVTEFYADRGHEVGCRSNLKSNEAITPRFDTESKEVEFGSAQETGREEIPHRCRSGSSGSGEPRR